MQDLGWGLGWVDLAFAAVVLCSALVGLVRGFVFEVLSLAGWLAAFLAAQALSSQLAPHLPVGEPGSALNAGASFALTFFVALVIWGLVARLVRLLIRATPLSLIDRLLGAGFGLLRALLLLLVIATVVALTPAAQSPAWTQSHAVPWLQAALQVVKPLLPDAVARHIAS